MIYGYDCVQGLVDLDVEIAKCEKKLDLARLNLGKILKVEGQADYEETVPNTVRLANEEKVRDLATLTLCVQLSEVILYSGKPWRRRFQRLSHQGICSRS
jgi:hypothetical protein